MFLQERGESWDKLDNGFKFPDIHDIAILNDNGRKLLAATDACGAAGIMAKAGKMLNSAMSCLTRRVKQLRRRAWFDKAGLSHSSKQF